jgi:AAA+ superfamily predicted ATPase
MQVNDSHNWLDANQRFLMASIGSVRSALEAYIAKSGNAFNKTKREKTEEHFPDALKINMQPPPALKTLCTTFGLSNFERDTLLLCAGMELDAKFPGLCATAQGDPAKAYPTFSLALAALSEPHWSTLSPAAPLRHWRLIEIGTAHALTLSPLRIDERILNYLAGVQHLDGRLAEYLEPIEAGEELVPSHRKLADQVSSTWANANGRSALPIIQLTGNENAGKRGIAAAACKRFGLWLNAFSAQFMPSNQSEIRALVQLLTRESFLSTSALLLDCDHVDRMDSVRITAIHKLIESFQGVLLVTSREPWQLQTRLAVTLEVRKPTTPEQSAIWQKNLGPAVSGMNGHIQTLVSQFSMNLQSISSVSAELQSRLNQQTLNSNEFGQLLWNACRVHSRPRLDDLAQFIEPFAIWDDIVLPEQEKQVLKEIAIHLRQRIKVYENWGFANKGKRGLGISALFAGASGTGKTMAAEVLANELRLDLYRIDLSSVVSKYIGETEKNLRRVFDAAEDSGTILLFDEADALFGKRSEVKDSHDRYANIEVSYLLQRMEAYRGLAILTTNRKSALDTAFLRRLRFIVNFPFPDAAQRADIWNRIFPASTPTEGLDIQKLANLNIAGGNIRNIALNAAFLAAEAGEPVRMPHLLRAARSEYAKIEKSLAEAEVRGWV